MKRMTEIRVQQNMIDGGSMMVVTETPEKAKQTRFVTDKAGKKWEDLTPSQQRRELMRNSGKLKPQPIEPNPFDHDEGIIPLKPIDD